MNRRNLVFFIVTLVGVILDQVTKAWIIANVELRVGRISVIPGFFDIEHHKNPGAAFSLLADSEYRHVVFFVFTIIAGYVIFDLFRKLPETDTYMSAALGLILSGAVGNAIDRVRFQEVTDFLVVDLPLYGKWPAFNVADSTLVVGVAMLIIHYAFFDDSRSQKDGEGEASKEPTESSEASAAS